jgi:hypothetical protein
LGDLQSFAQSLVEDGLAPISRARTLAAVKSLFGFCLRMHYVSANPAAELTLPSYEKRLAERIVGEEDVRRLVEADANPRDRVLLRPLYAAGLRVSEACGLLWRNVRPRGDSGPDYCLRQERPHAVHRPACAAVVGIDRPPGNCGGGGTCIPIAQREALGPRARPRNRAPGS